MEQEILDKVSETFHIKRDKLSLDTGIEEIAIDSLDVFELLAVLEGDYGVRMEPERMGEIKTVGDLVSYVTEHKGMQARPDRDALNRF